MRFFVATLLRMTVFFMLFCHDARAGQEVRVLVGENQKSFRVTVYKGYKIQALPSLKEFKKGQGLSRVSVESASVGLKVGGESVGFSGIRITPQHDRDLFLNESRFRGALDIIKNSDGALSAVNRIDIESYLYGVLPHEVAPWWPIEALKAQAIAARTYAIYQSLVNSVQPFDLKSSTSSQVYRGSTVERYRARRAVDLTKGKVLMFQGKIFPAYFHAACGGVTASSEELWKIKLPPLKGSVRCSYCRFSPHAHWRAEIPLSQIEEKMNQNGRPLGQILKIEEISRTPSGRVGSLRIIGVSQETVMAAKDFRIWLGGDKIRSTAFRVALKDDVAEFHGKGWGHGVGFCQWGAFGQALVGRTYEEILEFYYPSSKIETFRK